MQSASNAASKMLMVILYILRFTEMIIVGPQPRMCRHSVLARSLCGTGAVASFQEVLVDG